MRFFQSNPLLRSFFFAWIVCTGCVLWADNLFIPEPGLQRAIARSLGVSEKNLSQSLIENQLIRLQANDLGLRDLTGLEHAKNLESLVLRDNLIKDLSPIQGLPKLKNLDLSGNRLTSLLTLAPLPGSSLRILNLSRNHLLGLSGVAGFGALTQLDVSSNALIDLEGVSNLKGLVNLYAQENQLGREEGYADQNRNKQFDEGESFTDDSGNGKRDTDPLVEVQNLPNLASLHLYGNRISSVDSLRNLPSLHTLLLSGNLVESVSPLSRFSSLKILALGNNRIHTLDGIADLHTLERLNLSENQLCDLRMLRGLKNLTTLDLNSNMLTDLTDLSGLSRMEILGLSRNLIRDPSPVTKLPQLRRLTISFNQIPTDHTRIKDLFREVEARGVYINARNQTEYRLPPSSLVRSLVGHPRSNEILADYLRDQGYARFIDLLLNNNVNQDDLDIACKAWEKALTYEQALEGIPFPGN
jgi:Leucine-rich repeat (LRR) protein